MVTVVQLLQSEFEEKCNFGHGIFVCGDLEKSKSICLYLKRGNSVVTVVQLLQSDAQGKNGNGCGRKTINRLIEREMRAKELDGR